MDADETHDDGECRHQGWAICTRCCHHDDTFLDPEYDDVRCRECGKFVDAGELISKTKGEL